jgi:hypothetical protein
MFWPGFEAGVWREGRTCNVIEYRDGWASQVVSISVEEGAQTGWGGFVLVCSLAGWGGQRKVVRVVQDLDAQAAWAVLVQRAEDRAGDNEGEFQAQRTMHTADEERQTERDSGRVYEML